MKCEEARNSGFSFHFDYVCLFPSMNPNMYLPKYGADPDETKVGSMISHVELWVSFVRRTIRGTCKIKVSDAQVRELGKNER